MANTKKDKFTAAIKRIPKNKLGDKNLLSKDLASKIGRLEDREKITIRLDYRIIEAAKNEADELGVSFHKIINDRLLDMYSIGKAGYLKNDSKKEIEELSKQIEDMNKRLRKLERKQA